MVLEGTQFRRRDEVCMNVYSAAMRGRVFNMLRSDPLRHPVEWTALMSSSSNMPASTNPKQPESMNYA